MKPSIFVATPNLGEISTDVVFTVLPWIMSGKYQIFWSAPQYYRPGDRARNICHKLFLESGYEYLFFLDERVVPPMDTLDRLLAADRPIIGAAAQMLKHENGRPLLLPVAMDWYPEDNGYKPQKGKLKGIRKVDVVTCACTLIKREVMEAVGPRAFAQPHGDEWGTTGQSCEFYFCDRVREKGYEIFVDYDILCDHYVRAGLKSVNALMNEAHGDGANGSLV